MPGRSAAPDPRAPLAAARGADAVSGRSDQAAAPSTTHGHLWTLPEGTGLHAPLGRLVDDPATGRLCCHLCGRWFLSLGAHVRAHGYTADAYRDTMQLLRTRAGNLESWQRLERVGTSRAQLAAGRATRARRREAHLAALLIERGAPDLSTFLRAEYAAGASLQTLAQLTGLGRNRLRADLAAAEITVRPTGCNTPAGKRSRAQAADAAAAARVGTGDLHGWLTARYDQGWSLTRLAAAVGHSAHWVRWRLDAASQGSESA